MHMLQTQRKGASWWRELISSGCSAWNRTSKLIFHRLLWRRRALICCQCNEAAGPGLPSNAQALMHNTFHSFLSSITWPHNKGYQGQNLVGSILDHLHRLAFTVCTSKRPVWSLLSLWGGGSHWTTIQLIVAVVECN